MGSALAHRGRFASAHYQVSHRVAVNHTVMVATIIGGPAARPLQTLLDN